jgi:diaminohydroxyphosphoribosylaminopyrimidine deaminase/5-amino-6-(5-phosphoribosylamino)uracil reductase
MVEGGSQVLHAFLESGLWDEARVIHADKELGSGLPAPNVHAPCTKEEVSASDRILYYYKQS